MSLPTCYLCYYSVHIGRPYRSGDLRKACGNAPHRRAAYPHAAAPARPLRGRVDQEIDPYKSNRTCRGGLYIRPCLHFRRRPYTHATGFAVGAAFMAARTAVRSAEISRESQLPHGRG